MRRPTLNSAEWDFSYLDKYEHLKRAAVLYEYGRENGELVKWILYLREFGPFGGGKLPWSAKQAVRDKIQQRIHREIDVLSYNEIIFLATSKSFPNQPFRSAWKHLDLQVCRYVKGGIISEPIRQIREIPDGSWYRTHAPSSAADQAEGKEESVHIFAVPCPHRDNAVSTLVCHVPPCASCARLVLRTATSHRS